MEQKVVTSQEISQLIDSNSRMLDFLVKSIFDTTSKPVLVVSKLSIVHSNISAVKVFGYSPKSLKELLITDIFEFETPGQRQNFVALFGSQKKNHQDVERCKVKQKNGKSIWVTPNVRRCLWNGKTAFFVSLIPVENVDDERNDSVNELELLALKNIDLAFWDYHPHKNQAYFSSGYTRALGYNSFESELTLSFWKTTLHPDSLADFSQNMLYTKSIQEPSFIWEYRIKNREGNYLWMRNQNQVIEWSKAGTPTRIVGVHTCIDEYKTVEMEKDSLQQTLTGFIKCTKEGVILLDERGVVVDWNQSMEVILQIKRDAAIGKAIDILCSPVDDTKLNGQSLLEELKELVSSIIRNGKNPIEHKCHEVKVSYSDESLLVFSVSLSIIHTQNGHRIAVTVKDVTESRHNNIKIEKSEERLKLALSAGNVGIWDYDFLTNVQYFSPMTFKLFGYLPGEVEPTEEFLKSIIHPEDTDRVSQQLNAFFVSGETLETELRTQRKDGSYIWILSKNRMIRNERGKKIRVTGTITDISRQKRNEIQLRQSQEHLTKNLRQHEILSEISYLLNSNKNFSTTINEVIKVIGRFTKASRVYIFENNQGKGITVNTFEWCNEGIEPQIDKLQDVPLDIITDWSRDTDYMTSRNLSEDLPPGFADMMIAQEIKSFIIFPLQIAGRSFGYIGFDECTYERAWERSEIELLKTISNLISFYYEREAIKKQHQLNEERVRELTDKLPQIIFEVSLTGRIIFLNQTGCFFFGISKEQVEAGEHIWHLFPLREIIKMKNMRDKVLEAIDLEPIRLEVQTAENHLKPMVFYIRPLVEGSEITSFSGIALQPED